MAADRVGEILGNYTLVRLLGQGSFAEVYLGEHRYLERPVAIKVLHVRMQQSTTHEAFLAEAKLIARLQHPHLVQVLDFGIQEDTPYLVMDYAPNGTLHSRHPSGTPLAWEQILSYVKQIAEALDYAHAQHIIHRDIKPDNLLLNAKDEIVVSDFGIAVVQHTLDSFSTQNRAGTPLYMAPEQIQQHPCAASDQYAVGVMVYEWLCGEPPFPGPGLAIFAQHLYQEPPRLCGRIPDLPLAVEDAVFGALAKDPGQRFATMQDFALVLEEAFFATQPLRISRSSLALTPVPVAPSIVSPQRPQGDEQTQKLGTLPRIAPHVPGRPLTAPLTHQQSVPSQGKLSHEQKNRQRLLQRVRSFWIEGVLEHSLHGAALLALGLQTQPDAVANPWNLVLQHPETTPTLLPAGTRITQVYDTADGELLILGAPGSGKTTLLLELARDLIARAEQDEYLPMPVVFNLSSWALKRQSLVDWLMEELNTKYQVPRKLATTMLEAEQILPLLDGLDEVATKDRTHCIETINSYRLEHGTQPLVVCSRSTDYLAQTSRVLLESAVLIQPLSSQHIEQALDTAGPAFSGIRAVLQQQQAMRDLVTTPLMLSVILLTYQGVSIEAMVHGQADLEQRVWTDYVARMVRPRGMKAHASLADTRHWLTYLAQQMRVHQQTIFYAEYMQTDWLSSTQQRTITWLTIRLPAILLGMLASLFISLLMGSDPSLRLVALLGGFVGDCLSQKTTTGTTRIGRHPFASKRVQFIRSIVLGTLLVASVSLPLLLGSFSDYALGDVMRADSILGVGGGLSIWFFQVLLLHHPRQHVSISSPRSSLQWPVVTWFTTIAPQRVWQAALVLGTGMWLSIGLSFWPGFGLIGSLIHELSYGRSTDLSYRLLYDLGGLLSFSLSYGLNTGVMVVLVSAILTGSMESLRFAERIHWTWRGLLRPEHLRNSLIVAGALFLFFGLTTGLSEWLSNGLVDGLSIGLSDGLSIGLSDGLSYWILLGLYQGMKQEHLEDQDRQRFNQGIHRSLRNGLLISLLSALLISAIGVLSSLLNVGLSEWLSNGLGYGLRYGLSTRLRDGLGNELRYELRYGLITGLGNELRYGLILLFAGIVIMWALSGGLTVLRHYLIRWMLARSHRFPLRAQSFLDEATERNLLQRVGGGYRFMHRRLLEYFASLDDPSTPPSPDHRTHRAQQQSPMAPYR